MSPENENQFLTLFREINKRIEGITGALARIEESLEKSCVPSMVQNSTTPLLHNSSQQDKGGQGVVRIHQEVKRVVIPGRWGRIPTPKLSQAVFLPTGKYFYSMSRIEMYRDIRPSGLVVFDRDCQGRKYYT